MDIVKTFKSIFSRTPKIAEADLSKSSFVYITIPESIQPIDRGDKYEDPLHELLEAASLGGVSGGGSSLSDERPDGTRVIEWCGIDVDVTDLDRALQLIRIHLPKLGAPVGTELEYTVQGVKLRDHLTPDGWQVSLARIKTHPGIGI